MRPRVFISALSAALVAGALASGCALAATPSATPPAASLTKIACRSTLAPTLRRVAVESVMRHLPGTRTLSVRVNLIETQPGQPPQTVGGGDLGRWLTPAVHTLGRNPNDVWRLAKSVYDVGAPASYRFAVDFRWEGAGDRVLARRSLSTRSCAVRELRPDVLVRSVTVTPLTGRVPHDRYVATIANRGATASGAFGVLLAPGGGLPTHTKALASLAPHAHVRVTFVGPACNASAPPTVVADPTDQVDDYDRANNALTVTCPAS